MSKIKAVFDVAPLLEHQWTGISNVIGSIAEKALDDHQIDWTFCFETLPLPRSFLEKLLVNQSGKNRENEFKQIALDGKPIDLVSAREYIGIFPHVKAVRNFFRKEASIIHDISPLITPQYHNKDNIDHFSNRIRLDIESSDHLFCVSAATQADIAAYFSVPKDKMSVIRLGANFDVCDISLALNRNVFSLEVEPYIVVLGTLEPRKNAAIVFDFLSKFPNFANKYKFIFVGKDGWLNEKSRLISRLKNLGISDEKVVFSGFITNTDRAILIANSSFCIYPSFFEGFGLPILEAAVFGKITVASNSSSIPEVAPDRSIFFDPASLDEFSKAMEIADKRVGIERNNNFELEEVLVQNHKFGWSSCYKTIASWIIEEENA